MYVKCATQQNKKCVYAKISSRATQFYSISQQVESST